MPISSTQMSGLVGGQQAMFGNMATYAAQISPFAPPGMAPTYTNPMQGAEFPPSMGYVPGQTSYAEGGAAAPGIIGGAAAYGAPALALGGALMGGRVGGMLDPMTGAMRGMGRGVGWQSGAGWGANLGRVMSGGIGGIARGIGMGAIGALPGLAIGGAIQYAGGQMMEGAQFQNQVGSFMQNQFRFANPMAQGGFGMGQQGVKNIGSMLHEMGTESIGSTPGEMLNIMKGATSQGVFRGVRDAKEFQAKFKETVSALKEIAKTFNTTLSEAMPMFGEAKRQGFWTPQDVTRHAQSIRQVQATTGMSAAAAQQYTGAMAQTVQQMGGTLQQGSMMGARALSMAGAASMGGWVNQQQLQNAGLGMGAEGVANFGMMMGNATSRFAQSRVGRWTLAATMGQGGKLDPEAMARLSRGDMSIGDIQRMAERNVGGAGTTGRPGGAMDFVNNEENLRGQFAEAGPGAMLGMVKTLTGGALYGSSNRDQLVTSKIIQRYFGGDKKQAGLMAEMARNMPQILQRQAAETEQQADAQQRQQQSAMQDTWQGVTRQVGQWWRENVTGPLQKMGADVSTGMSRAWQRMGEKLWGGGGRYGLSGSVVSAYAQSLESGDRTGFNRQFSTYGYGKQVMGGGLTGGSLMVGLEGTSNMAALGIAGQGVVQRGMMGTFAGKYSAAAIREGEALSSASQGIVGENEAKAMGYGSHGDFQQARGGEAGKQLQAFLRSGTALGIRGRFGDKLDAAGRMGYAKVISAHLRAGAGGEAIQRELSGVDEKTAAIRAMAMQGGARDGETGMEGIGGANALDAGGEALQDRALEMTETHAIAMRGGGAAGHGDSWLKFLNPVGEAQAAALGYKGVGVTVAGLEEVRKHPQAGAALSLFLEAQSLQKSDPEKAKRIRAQARSMAAEAAIDKKSGLSNEARAALKRFADPNDPEADLMARIGATQGVIRVKENIEGHKQTISARMSRMKEGLGSEGMDRLAKMGTKSEVAKIVNEMMGAGAEDPGKRSELYGRLAEAAAKDPSGASGVRTLLEGVSGSSEMTTMLDVVSQHKGLAGAKGGDTKRLKAYMGGMMGMQTSAAELKGLTTGKWGKGEEEKFKEKLKAAQPGWGEADIAKFMKQAEKGLDKGEVMERGVKTAQGAAARQLAADATKKFGVAGESATGSKNPLVEIAKNSAISRDYMRMVADNTAAIANKKEGVGKGPSDAKPK